MSGEQHEVKTKLISTGVDLCKSCEPMMYFHPGSATVLCVEGDDAQVLHQEHNYLTDLLEKQMAALERLDDVQFESLSLMQPQQRKLLKDLEAAYTEVNQANAVLRSELGSLTGDLPEGVMLDAKMKTSAIGLMELIPLIPGKTTGFKMTYVRSDKIQNHWKRYQLSEVDKKSGQASFIRYQEEMVKVRQVRDGKVVEVDKTVRRAKIDIPELKKQLTTLETKYNIKWPFVPDTTMILGKWAEEMNKSLTWPKDGDNPEQEEGEFPAYHQFVDLGAQAQLMRFSRGAGAEAQFNPRHQKVVAKVAGHSSFALGEAKAVTTLYLPDRQGIKLQFPTKNQGLSTLGALRFSLSAVLSGNVGASLGIEVGVHLDWSGDMAKGYGVRGRPAKLLPNGLPGARSINVLNQLEEPDAQVGGEIGVFVGAQAGANLSGAIEWYDPDPDITEIEGETSCTPKKVIHPKERQFKPIAKLDVGAYAQMGSGGSGAFYITYVKGRFRIYCKAALCWGMGGKGSLGFEVDGAHFAVFMKSFMYMLRNADYQKLHEIITIEAFKVLCTIPLILAAEGMRAVDAMMDEAGFIIDRFEVGLSDADKRSVLMKSIINNPDQLKYTLPETKGAVIALLIDTSWLDWVDRRNHGVEVSMLTGLKWQVMNERKKAIIATFKWVQSKADYRNVMQHLSKNPSADKGDFFDNENKVLNFLGRAEVRFMGPLTSQYEKKFRRLYDELPAWVGDVEPFIPVPKVTLDEYVAIIEEQYREEASFV
ncbi:MAG: hypothetical protein ACOH2R_27625 [Pseudomonas sp.]